MEWAGKAELRLKDRGRFSVLEKSCKDTTPSPVLRQNIVRSGYAIAQSNGKTLFFTKAGAVVLAKTGEVVTAYSAEYFDKAMQAIVKQFYG